MTVTGNIKDANTGDGLPFANVSVAGGHSTVTDVNGNYTLQANVGDNVNVSYVGYQQQMQTITGSTLNFALQDLTFTTGAQVDIVTKKPFPVIQLVWGLAAAAGLAYIIFDHIKSKA